MSSTALLISITIVVFVFAFILSYLLIYCMMCTKENFVFPMERYIEEDEGVDV